MDTSYHRDAGLMVNRGAEIAISSRLNEHLYT